MTPSLLQLFESLRDHGKTLPREAVAPLLGAAARLAALQRASLRPEMILLDAQQGMLLDMTLEAEAESRPGYIAPEVLAGVGSKTDPGALVYAAGALGFELVTGAPEPVSADAFAGIGGLLGAVLKRALAEAPQSRYHGLPELCEALAKLAPRDPQQERKLVMNLSKAAAGREGDGRRGGSDRRAPPKTESPNPAQVQPNPVLLRLEARATCLEAEPDKRSAALLAEQQWFAAHLAHQDLRLAELAASQRRAERALLESVTNAAAERQWFTQRLAEQSQRTAEAAAAAYRKVTSLRAVGAQLTSRLESLEGSRSQRSFGVRHLVAAALAGAAVAVAAVATLDLSAAPARPPVVPAIAATEGPSIALVGGIAQSAAVPPPLPATVQEAPSATPLTRVPVAQQPDRAAGPAPTAPATSSAKPVEAAAVSKARKSEQFERGRERRASTSEKRAAKDSRPQASRGSSGKAAAEATAAADRGEKALRQGHTDEAFAAFQEALAAHPNLSTAIRGLGMVYMSQGKEADAKKQFLRYLELSPSAPDAARIRKVVANLGRGEDMTGSPPTAEP